MIIYRAVCCLIFQPRMTRMTRIYFIYHLTIYNLRFCSLFLVNSLMNCYVEFVETSIMLNIRYVRPLDHARGDSKAKPL